MGPNDPFPRPDDSPQSPFDVQPQLLTRTGWDHWWVVGGMVVTAIAWVLGIGAALAILGGGILGGILGRFVQHIVTSPPDFRAIYKALIGATRDN